MTIGIDADGILFNYTESLAAYVRGVTGKDEYTYESATTWDCLTGWGLQNLKNDADFYFSSSEAVKNMSLMPDADIFMKGVRDIVGEDFLIVTACPVSWHRRRASALYYRFRIPEQKIAFIYEKHKMDISCLIDDYPENFRGFKGLGILPDRPWNRQEATVLFKRTQNVFETLDLLAEHVRHDRKWNQLEFLQRSFLEQDRDNWRARASV